MNLDDREDRLVAAGEYVLGTLEADERAVFERALGDDPALQADVYAWQDRLLPLAAGVALAPEAPAGWPAIESRLGPREPAPIVGEAGAGAIRHGVDAANDRLWRRLRRWRLASAVAIAASLVLAALLLLRAPTAPDRYLAVLQAPSDNATGWLVEITAGERVRLVPVGAAAPLPPGRALQFWTKPAAVAAPTSLGLVRPGAVTELPVARLPALEAEQLFELTLEPETGSPLARPTGPILFVGRTVRL